MKVNKRMHTDAVGPRKQLTKTINKNIKHFINRPKSVNNKCKSLFSLQHQSIDLLRKAEKFKLKKRKSQDNSLNNLIGDTSHETASSGNFNSKRRFWKHIVNKQDTSAKTFPVIETLNHPKNKKELNSPNAKNSKSEEDHGSFRNNIEGSCELDIVETLTVGNKCNISKYGTKSTTKGNKKLSKKDVDDSVDIAENNIGDLKYTENIDLHKNVKKSNLKKKKRKFHSENENSNKFDASFNFDDDLKESSWGSFARSSCSNADNRKSLSVDHIQEDTEDMQRDNNKVPVRDIENFPSMVFQKFNKAQILLTLVHPCSLYFIGVLEVEVLVGSVRVLGYTLDSLSGKHTVYSPRGVGHLSITTENNGKLDETSITELKRFGVDEDKINSIKEKFCEDVVIVVVNKDENDLTSIVWPIFVEKYTDICLLPRINLKSFASDVEKTLQCEFHLHSRSTKLYSEMPEWKLILDSMNVSDTSRTIVCGGKGVGKSTLLRYLVNQSLTLYKKVLVLDFDPGQSEFTVPGCISAIVVTSPLLGPSFSHLLTPLRSLFLGEISVVNNLKYYFVCVEDIVDFCNSTDEFRNIPWFVNTMGFNKGIGVLITASIIKKVSPTALIQIESEHESRNFKSKLTPEFVEANILNLSRSSNDSVPNYNLFVLPSAVQGISNKKKKNSVEDWGLAATSLRNIMVLSYFGQILNSNMKDFYSVEPFVVNLSDIHVIVINENLTGNALLDAVNGGLVALCYRSSNNYSLNICFGFGIVRAVNKETQQLFLLTPLAEDKLNQVNSLVKGNIALPNKLYTNPSKNVNGNVPYVSLTNNILSRDIKKTFKKIDMFLK